MLPYITTALWIFLPAGAANAAPVFAAKLPMLKNWSAPLDGGRSFRGNRILGDHKTWRGLLAGVLVGAIVGGLQYRFYLLDAATGISSSLALNMVGGAILGFGALMGDAIESFIKRQRGFLSGQGWFPFDQLDYIIGGLLAISPLMTMPLAEYAAVVATWFCLHLIATYAGYLLHLRENPI